MPAGAAADRPDHRLSGAPSDARRVSVPARRLARWLDNFADRHGALEVTASPTEVVVRGADGDTAWIEVPFPPLDITSRPLTSLQVHATRERRVGVLLVRRGGYAAGVFAGDSLVSSKVGAAYVQGSTKAGGWSQQRYARRRENQSRAAFAEAADTAARILLPEAERLAAVITGGDRAAVEAVLADPRLAPLRALRAGPWLNVPDPRLRVLQDSPESFLTVQIALRP